MGNVGVRNHLYTHQAESVFGRAETEAAPLIKDLLEGVDVLGDIENRRVLARFMAELMARQLYMATFRGLSPEAYVDILEVSEDTKSIHRTLRKHYGPSINPSDVEDLQRDIREMQDDLSKQWPDLTASEIKEKMREVAADPTGTQQLRSLVVEYPDSVALLEHFEDLWSLKEWLACESTSVSRFITSDQPVFKHPTWMDRNGIAPHDTICFVVSPMILLKVGANSGNHRWENNQVHAMNRYIAKHCDHQIISTPANEAYLNHLHIGTYRPWLHAQTTASPTPEIEAGDSATTDRGPDPNDPPDRPLP